MDDVEIVLKPAMEHGSFYFDELWQVVSEAERSVLKQIATGMFVTENSDINAIGILQSRKLIEAYQKGYRFQVPLMQRWVLHRLQTIPYP